MNSIVIHAWSVKFDGNNYYLPYTHWVYLNEIVKYYNEISLISSVTQIKGANNSDLVSIKNFRNVSVIDLPPSNSYVKTIKYFYSYLKVYKNLKNYGTVYTRYPIPFGWLQKLYCSGAKRIIHFVGDPIDAAKNNPNFSLIKKKLLVTLFKPEHMLYLWACKGARVYTNGHHLAERLKREGISAIPLISTTLNAEDFFWEDNKIIDPVAPKILYVGYLRKAKGVETVISTFRLLKEIYPEACLNIVGDGEFKNELQKIANNYNLKDITFFGHIDNRKILNDIIRSNDIFCFASLSEGSPRVILEAMANNINIISTPVGSLPKTFLNGEEILYADFNNEEMFLEKIIKLLNDPELAYNLRLNAYNKAKNYTIESFLNKIFHVP